MKKIDKHFISDIDQKLSEFNANGSKSKSQQAEIKKHQRIKQLRDNATIEKASVVDSIWEDF